MGVEDHISFQTCVESGAVAIAELLNKTGVVDHEAPLREGFAVREVTVLKFFADSVDRFELQVSKEFTCDNNLSKYHFRHEFGLEPVLLDGLQAGNDFHK